MGDAHEHSLLKMLPTFLALVSFLIACVFNGLAGSSVGVDAGLFKNATGDISAKYDTQVTPSGWTFSIWGIIYFWQAAWLLYGVSLLFRKGPDGYLYRTVDIIPASIYITYTINMLANITWLLLWGNDQMTAALVLIIIMAATSLICISLSVKQLGAVKADLTRLGLVTETILVVALVQNGLAIYDTWLDIATLLNMTIVMSYEGSVSAEDAATVALVILMIIIVGWCLLDIIFLDYITRWLITPYFVFFFALAGIIDQNHADGGRNATFTVVLEVFAVILTVIKLVMSTWRQLRGPLALDATLERKQILSNVSPPIYT